MADEITLKDIERVANLPDSAAPAMSLILSPGDAGMMMKLFADVEKERDDASELLNRVVEALSERIEVCGGSVAINDRETRACGSGYGECDDCEEQRSLLLEVAAYEERRAGGGARMPDDRLTYTIKEAAALLGVSMGLVYRSVRDESIPSVRVGRRILIPRKAFDGILEQVDER